MKNKSIKTERLVIKVIDNEDIEDLVNILNNKEIAKTYMLPIFTCKDDVYKLANRFVSLSNNENKYLYGIYLKDKIIGFVNEVEKDDDIIEVGYVIDPNYQNKGYATEMLKEVIKDLFTLGFKKVKAGFFIDNIASKKVMEKCNMIKIDFEEDITYRDKTYHCVYYEITKQER